MPPMVICLDIMHETSAQQPADQHKESLNKTEGADDSDIMTKLEVLETHSSDDTDREGIEAQADGKQKYLYETHFLRLERLTVYYRAAESHRVGIFQIIAEPHTSGYR